jgi:hypothetical protein
LPVVAAPGEKTHIKQHNRNTQKVKQAKLRHLRICGSPQQLQTEKQRAHEHLAEENAHCGPEAHVAEQEDADEVD